MTEMRLRRHAPEAQAAQTCSVCGRRKPPGEAADHLLVGTPGTPQFDGAVCEACGAVLGRVVDQFGPHLSITVEESQRQASSREITIPPGARWGAQQPT